MLCGLLENIMGWHLDVSDRIQIEKDLEAIRKKQKVEFQSAKEGSTYIPLLMEYFEIETTIIPDGFAYSDLWSRAFRRGDADVHPKGTPNISFELIPKKSGVEIIDLYKANIGGFPMYYSTPTHREYFVINDSIEIIINCDSNIIKTLEKGIEDNNIAYLGNSFVRNQSKQGLLRH
jgi:CRISPR-associated protein Cas5